MKRSLFAVIALALVLVLPDTVYAFHSFLVAGPVPYDVAYVRCPRYGDSTPAKFQDVSNPTRLDPGCDLMRLHPDGSEDLIVAGGLGSVADIQVSFDGLSVLYSYFPNLQPDQFVPALSGQGQLPKQGADIYRVVVATKQITRITNGGYQPAKNGALSGYGVLNIHPTPLPGGKIMFASNRFGYLPTKGFTPIDLQLFTMDDDGENVECIGPLSLGSVLHPQVLVDGRVMFSTSEAQGLRDSRMWGMWAIWPDGRIWEPLVSAFHTGQSFHFATQTSNGDLVVEDYYNQNNGGFGMLLRFPLNGAPLGQSKFGSPTSAKNPPIHMNISTTTTPVDFPWRMPFQNWGLTAVTPNTHFMDSPAPPGEGKFTMPSGAPNNDLLTVWSPGPVNGKQPIPQPDAGLYVIRGGGPITSAADLVLIKNDPNYNELWPRALVPYKAIYNVDAPKQLSWLPNDGTVHPSLPAGTPYGLIGTSGVYKRNSAWGGDPNCAQWICQGSDAGSYDNSEIAALRIVMQEPSPDYGNGPQKFFSHAMERLRILGDIPLRKFDAQGKPILDLEGNPDTSFLAKIPADHPFTFQLVDKNGRVLSVSQTWHQVRPGEARMDCGGCHAHAELPLDFATTEAAKPSYRPVDLTAATPRSPDFGKDIRPILQRACVSCHGGPSPAALLKLDDQALVGGIYQSLIAVPGDYARLAADSGVPSRWGPPPPQGNAWLLPFASRYLKKFQSRCSLLIWVLENARPVGCANDVGFTPTPTHAGKVTAEELKTVSEWIDLGAPYDAGGWQTDTQRPALTVSSPRPNGNKGPLTALVVGAADGNSGLNLTSLSLTADVAIAGKPAGTQLPGTWADGVYTVKLTPPITTLTAGHLTATIADKAGNVTTQKVRFSVNGVIVDPPPSLPAPTNPGFKSSVTVTSNAALTWGAVSGAVRYEIEIRTEVSKVVVEGNKFLIVPRYEVQLAAMNQKYLWRVRAYPSFDTQAVPGPWSKDTKLER